MRKELKEKIIWEIQIFLLFTVGFSICIAFGVFIFNKVTIDYIIFYVLPFTFVFLVFSYILGSMVAFGVKRIVGLIKNR